VRLNQKRVARQSNLMVTRTPRAQRAWSRLHARLYKATGGRFIPRWFAGAPVMVLETVGRKSGKKRSSPVLYLREGDALVVLAANAGADRVPAWWHNLEAAGEAEVVVEGRRSRVRPRVLDGEERRRAWEDFVAMYPQAQEYTRFTARELPLAALEPSSQGTP
jgi:F420H(2)-dependent quinone reductase